MREKKRIVVIESERDARELISRVLEPRGMEVFSFSNPDEAITKAGEIGPDLIFISILFPESNGLKVSKALHSMDALKKVPVIMLISYAGEIDPRYTSTIGIVDVIVKPLNAGEVLSKTAAILGEESVSSDAGEIATEVPAAEEGGPSSLDEEWLTYLDKEDRAEHAPGAAAMEESESEAPHAEERDEEPITAWRDDMEEKGGSRNDEEGAGGKYIEKTDEEKESPAKKNETEAFLAEEEEERREPEDEPFYGHAAQKDNSLKKILLIAGVIVVIAGAGLGAYLFFQGTGSKPVVPAAKAPVSAAPVAKRQELPVDKVSSPGQTQAKADNPSVPPAGAGGAKNEAASAGEVKKPLDTKKAPASVSPAQKTAKKANEEKKQAAAREKKGTYSVQVGAFQNEKNAVALAERLKKKGYAAFIRNDGGKAGHKVLIGKFDASAKAGVQAKLILRKEGLKAIVCRY